MENTIQHVYNIIPFKKEIDSDEYRDGILTKLEKYWKNGKSCDLILDVNGVEFYCHKAVLICMSSYFMCLAKYDFKKPDLFGIYRVQLHSVDSRNVESILEYIYTGEVICNINDMLDVIYTADYFMLDSMLKSVSISLKHYFTVDNAADYFQLAKNIQCNEIYSAVLKFLVRNIFQIHLSKRLASFSSKDLLEILKDQRLIIRRGKLFAFGNEFRKYSEDIILGWAESDEVERNRLVPELIETVNKLITESMYDKLKLEKYRYVEPISRAYFFNSIPFGRHPPSLVSAPFNFRCLSRNIKRTFIDNPPQKWFIKRIILYIIPDWNNVATIGDIQIDYKNYWTGELQAYRAVMDNYTGYTKEEVLLDDDERIVEMDVYHGWMIYGITFYTSSKRVLGVYGSSNAELSHISFQEDYPNALYLHGFAFISISSKDWYAINWLTIYGTMIDKEAYQHDFDCTFEADIGHSVKKKENIDLSSTSNDCSTLSFQPENYLNELNYPLPHSLEDLFYQWRRYMRIMRLSVIRRHESIITTRHESSVLPSAIPEGHSPNHSSPEFSNISITREI